MRRTGIGILTLFGLLAGQHVAQAQFGSPYGGGNPFTAQRQYLYNLQVGRAAMANSMVNNPGYASPFAGTPAYNPYMAYGGNPYAGFGANPYTPGTPGVSLDPTAGGGSNPYAPLSGAGDPYVANPYSPLSPYGSPYSNPALGPGFTLMGAADVMRAYGTVITKQEQARIMRQEVHQARLVTAKNKFDLDMYIKEHTPTFNQEQEKITKSILKRIQERSNPAEVVEGRSHNFLLDDVDKNYTKGTGLQDIPLEESVLKHLNVKPAGIGNSSLGLLRDGGKLNWPSALVELLTPEARNDIEAKAQTLANNASKARSRIGTLLRTCACRSSRRWRNCSRRRTALARPSTWMPSDS